MKAVIMASGQGSRLWPLSRQHKPKQFHPLIGKNSLLQDTFFRMEKHLGADNIYIVTTEEYRQIVEDQLPQSRDNIITEPFANGTFCLIGTALQYLSRLGGDDNVIFLPSDHIINDVNKYEEILNYCEEVISKFPDKILTIGINPTSADTGMGYIKIGKELDSRDDLRAFSARGFEEKPDQKTAEKYLASWQYLWNSGMFAGKISTISSLYKNYSRKYSGHFESIGQSIGTPKESDTKKKQYSKIENTSIDYAIMEKLDEYIVIPCDFGWSDVGSWGTLIKVLADHYDSRVVAKGNHIGINDKNCLVLGQEKMIATVGLEDVAIIETEDVLLVCKGSHSQEIKELLERLKKEGKHLYL